MGTGERENREMEEPGIRDAPVNRETGEQGNQKTGRGQTTVIVFIQEQNVWNTIIRLLKREVIAV